MKKLRIAIIGGTGLLGSNLLKLYSNYDVKSFSREQSYNVDKTKNNTIDFNYLEDELYIYFTSWKPNIIVNTVAIVNLQKCEDDYEYASKVNAQISVTLSKIAKQYTAYFIQISTDHYFNDNKKFHTENDEVTLLNNYAKTKYDAEKKVIEHYSRCLIVRTNIIGFRRRTAKSFFEWLLFSLENKEKVYLYTNFYTSPISVNELGKILIKCYYINLIGTYNIASSEVIDKYSFAIKTANKFGFGIENIIKSELNNNNLVDLKRALTLGLNVSSIEKKLHIKMPIIDDTLEYLFKEYKESNE